MTTRADIVDEAASFDGYHDNAGYDTANEFSANLGLPSEASCADFYTDIYRRKNLSFPSMQAGHETGFSFVPSGWAAAKDRDATRVSWESQPGDGVVFHWPGGNPDGDHIECQVFWHAGVLRTIGMNSGPSNVDKYKGRGGVHYHDWICPEGKGSDLVVGTIDAAKLVHFGGKGKVVPPKPVPAGPRRLLLKSPNMHGADVTTLQKALNALEVHNVTVDGVFGPATHAAVLRAQARFQDPTGVVGHITRTFLKIA